MRVRVCVCSENTVSKQNVKFMRVTQTVMCECVCQTVRKSKSEREVAFDSYL